MSPARAASRSPRRTFGQTWWGRAWVEALEDRAQLDANRLPRGRTYARRERAEDLDVDPGEVVARIQGRRDEPYRVRLRVRQLDAGAWEAVSAAIADRAAYAAALLDGELHPGIVEAARDAGVELLPGPGELGPSCTCPDWADPCKHAAAVCYLVADLLDADPFALLLLRGRTREELLAAVRIHRADATAAEPDERVADAGLTRSPDRGVVARDALRRPAAPLPAAAPVPRRPGTPRPLAPLSDPDDALPTPEDLLGLATDAARRAHAMLAAGAPSALDLDPRADLARRLADLLGSQALAPLARRTGVGPSEAVRLALAWQHGGAVGVGLVDGTVAPRRDAVRLGDLLLVLQTTSGTRARGRLDRVVVGDVELVIGPDDRWYALERRGRRRELQRPPSDDPLSLLDDAVGGPPPGR